LWFHGPNPETFKTIKTLNPKILNRKTSIREVGPVEILMYRGNSVSRQKQKFGWKTKITRVNA
jgi:hypothetical protein